MNAEYKICVDCGEEKPRTPEFFPINGRTKYNKPMFRNRCRICWRDRPRDYKKESEKRQAKYNSKDHYAYMIKSKYGLTVEALREIWIAQGEVCAICRKSEPDSPKRWEKMHVDHDHQTKQVRGLLCPGCNMGLGKFKDSAALLENAMHYLRKNSAFDQYETHSLN